MQTCNVPERGSRKVPIPYCMFGLIIFVTCALLLATWSARNLQDTSTPAETVHDSDTVQVVVGALSVRADVADTTALQRQGLSGRAVLEPGTGMWFVYDKLDYHTFWMPDMNFALDIIWFDTDLTVVHIQEHATPEAYPDSYRPSAPALYVLEVPSGTVAEHSLVLGMRANVQ